MVDVALASVNVRVHRDILEISAKWLLSKV
jgi:hypothetical protein